MATAIAPYYEFKPYINATIAASTRIDLPTGLGSCAQVLVHVKVGDVTGGSDAIDFDLDTSYTKTAAGVEEWTEVLSMTQNTAASSETKYAIRTASVGWGDRMSLEVTVAAGATATGVSVTIVGANA
jgi:hypothetical protein